MPYCQIRDCPGLMSRCRTRRPGTLGALTVILLSLSAGCSVSPVPDDMELRLRRCRQTVPILNAHLQEGDIVFRLGNTQLLGGALDFSKVVADATDSSFSHAVLVYEQVPDGFILADITPTGIARRYVSDWFLDGTTNVAVKRLKPEYRAYTPLVLARLREHIEEQVPYDSKFEAADRAHYCTELVDECFRQAGLPLASRIRIRDFPKYDWFFWLGCTFGGIDTNSEVVVAGNERIGLFSSDKLELVVDLRGVIE